MHSNPHDPTIGTWRLSLNKSTFSPTGSSPKSLSLKIEQSSEGVKVTADGVDARGHTTHSVYTANYDGRDYPITGSATADTISMRRVNASTTERTDRKHGKVVETRSRTVSPDGKVLTIAFQGNYSHGHLVHHELVFEKQ
jgi:hypothetical protein